MLTKLYYAMPQWARTLAASAYGYYLYSWRYGRDTEQLVRDALDKEQWDAERLTGWQEEQVAALLHHAATTVPFYREAWRKRRLAGDRSSWDRLENWPLLDKQAVRATPRAFLSDTCHPNKLFRTHTSGTTGTPLQLWQSRTALRQWYALTEARWRRWYGVTRDDRWAILGGQMIVPVGSEKPPFWVWNHGLRQLYMSSYHLSAKLIPSYFDALKRYRVSYIWGYTSALYALAQQALLDGRDDLRFKVAITNAEPLSPDQRATIARAFHCPVRETYGMSEMVAAASECEHNHLHLWPGAGVVEVFDGEVLLSPGQTGELVCTGLMNRDMPLIRYRVGDRGALAPPEFRCACGRSLAVLQSIEGRIDDVLYTASGRQVGRLDPVFKADLPVREVQLVQRTLEEIQVNIVPASQWSSSASATIAARLRERLGTINVTVNIMEAIPRGPNGKFRAVVCELDPGEIRKSVTAT